MVSRKAGDRKAAGDQLEADITARARKEDGLDKGGGRKKL